MTRVTDFNNTWCEATEENYNKLVKFNLGKLDYVPNNGFLYVLDKTILNSTYTSFLSTDFGRNLKQIKLIDNDFYYVDEEKEEDSFNKFGFETPEFEGEILKTTNMHYMGYIKENDCFYTCQWDKLGNIWDSENKVGSKKYCLTPLKKKWYKDKNNFEKFKNKLIINKYGNVRKIQYIDESKVTTLEQNMYHDILNSEEWRPITKEEVLKLVIEEN